MNPAEPPLVMRDTVYCQLPDNVDEEAISASISEMVREVSTYVPGYRPVVPHNSAWRAMASDVSRCSSKSRERAIFFPHIREISTS